MIHLLPGAELGGQELPPACAQLNLSCLDIRICLKPPQGKDD